LAPAGQKNFKGDRKRKTKVLKQNKRKYHPASVTKRIKKSRKTQRGGGEEKIYGGTGWKVADKMSFRKDRSGGEGRNVKEGQNSRSKGEETGRACCNHPKGSDRRSSYRGEMGKGGQKGGN